MGLTRYKLGELIELVDERNVSRTVNKIFGININKEFMPTKASVKEENIDKYKIIRKNRFIFSGMQTGRDKCIRTSIYRKDEPIIVSLAYSTFEIVNKKIVIPEYLFMIFSSREKDRLGWFLSDSSIRANLDWDVFCDIDIDLPPIEIQQKYVDIYNGLLENQRAYESGLEDLKLVCDGYLDKLKKIESRRSIGKIIELVDVRNNERIKKVEGINNNKQFIDSNANVNNDNLSNYKIVDNDEFVFSGMQTGRDRCIRIALNDSVNKRVVSPAYTVFRISDEYVLSDYFMMWFTRNEIDRLGWFLSDSSVRSNLDLDRFYEIEIPLPDIKIQESIANIYKVYKERKRINEQLKTQIKEIYPILIRGAMLEAGKEY